MGKKKSKIISSIQEDYLEAIYRIIVIEKNPAARVVDIADKLKVNKPNVSNMMKVLSEKKYINYNTYRWITLTEKGFKKAKETYNRHIDLIDFFHNILGVDKKVAEENACRIEHAIDCELMAKFREFAKKIKSEQINT